MSNQNFRLFTDCEAIVCDLDGTLYLDGIPFQESFEFLDKVISSGKKLYYFTNNTSKSRNTYLQKIADIGFPIADENLITSADCADSYLKRKGFFPNIYLVGNRDLKEEFSSRGYNCLSEKSARQAPPKAVLIGFDTELNYEKIHCCYDLILQGIPYIATHADLLCPITKTTFKPDVGSFMSMFKTATGGVLPKVVGKPHKDAVMAISERAKLKPEKIAFIGDRLYTDIRMAKNYNMVGVLVLSGETTAEMAKASIDKPKLLVDSIKDLIPHL